MADVLRAPVGAFLKASLLFAAVGQVDRGFAVTAADNDGERTFGGFVGGHNHSSIVSGSLQVDLHAEVLRFLLVEGHDFGRRVPGGEGEVAALAGSVGSVGLY